jgi:hypothetical protein
VQTTCNLLETVSLNFEFNSAKNESNLLLIWYPDFSNCKIEAFGPLKPKALGCAGLSLMHQGNYKLQLTYCCH